MSQSRFDALTQNGLRPTNIRVLESTIVAGFIGYILYELQLSKLFSPSVGPDWYRDLGILWTLADYAVDHHRYQIGEYFFPPPNAVIAHVFGLIDRGLAFRLFLLLHAGCFLFCLWAWSGYIGLLARPERGIVMVVACVAAGFYIHFDFHMHNLNMLTFALVTAAMVAESRTIFSAACYSLAVGLKPHGSVLLLPMMLWTGLWRWIAAALVALCIVCIALPCLYFGVTDTVQLYRDWIESLVAAGRDYRLSMRGGIAALLGVGVDDPSARAIELCLVVAYAAALLAFFWDAIRTRRILPGLPMACSVAALLLVPLPLGPNQQLPRAVVILASTIIMASAMFDRRRSRSTRLWLALLLAGIALPSHLTPIGPLHCLLTFAVCLACLGGLAIARSAKHPN